MSDLDIAELTLIDLSRVQREALERWVPILCTAGETELAAEVTFLKSLLPTESKP
jgi:hypothetical protein